MCLGYICIFALFFFRENLMSEKRKMYKLGYYEFSKLEKILYNN
jgi:hypothetical protein